MEMLCSVLEEGCYGNGMGGKLDFGFLVNHMKEEHTGVWAASVCLCWASAVTVAIVTFVSSWCDAWWPEENPPRARSWPLTVHLSRHFVLLASTSPSAFKSILSLFFSYSFFLFFVPYLQSFFLSSFLSFFLSSFLSPFWGFVIFWILFCLVIKLLKSLSFFLFQYLIFLTTSSSFSVSFSSIFLF